MGWRCTVSNTFSDALAFGRIGESRISYWLQARGHLVMPAYEKELSSGKGPQLDRAQGDLVLPDMLVFNKRQTLWAEAKHKSVWTWHRASRSWTTGVCLRHYEHYCEVARRTEMPVWLMFWHPNAQPSLMDVEHGCPVTCPPGLFGGSLAELTHCESHRSMRWGKHGMVYWALKDLRRLATVADVELASHKQPRISHDDKTYQPH